MSPPVPPPSLSTFSFSTVSFSTLFSLIASLTTFQDLDDQDLLNTSHVTGTPANSDIEDDEATEATAEVDLIDNIRKQMKNTDLKKVLSGEGEDNLVL